MRIERWRIAELETKARALARSGRHSTFRSIQALLVGEYPEARKLFANRWTQQELDRICQQARDSQRSARALEDDAFLKLGQGALA